MTAADSGKPRLAMVDRLFADWEAAPRPGGAVAVVMGERIVHSGCYGFADVEAREPFRPDLCFPIASVTKQFTALCILLLEEQGRISLDDALQTVLPGATAADTPITVRQLCNNTSGLRDHITLATYAGGYLMERTGRSGIEALIARQATLNFPPGSRYCYSNTNYVLLSWIIERLTGRSLPDAFASLIFRPLGMNTTALVERPLEGPRPAVTGYVGNGDAAFRRWNCSIHMFGEGGIWSTLDDLVKWEINFTRPVVGSPALLARLGERGRLNDGTPIAYALGLTTGVLHGHEWEGHSGGFDGCRSFRMRFPAMDLGIIVLANFTADIQGAANEVASLFLPGAVTPPHLAGRYRSAELGTTYTITVEDGQPLLSVDGPEGSHTGLPLIPRGDLAYGVSRAARARWPLEFQTELRFEVEGGGSATRLVVGCEWASGLVFDRLA